MSRRMVGGTLKKFTESGRGGKKRGPGGETRQGCLWFGARNSSGNSAWEGALIKGHPRREKGEKSEVTGGLVYGSRKKNQTTPPVETVGWNPPRKGKGGRLKYANSEKYTGTIGIVRCEGRPLGLGVPERLSARERRGSSHRSWVKKG